MKSAQTLVFGIALLWCVGCGSWSPVVPQENAAIGGDHDTNAVTYAVNPAYENSLRTAREINRLVPSPLQGLIELALAGISGGLAVWAKLRSGQKKVIRNMITSVAKTGDEKVKTELAKQLALAGLVPQFREEIKNLVS